MVNKVSLEVDTRYSGYAKCNVGQNGTDGQPDNSVNTAS